MDMGTTCMKMESANRQNQGHRESTGRKRAHTT